MCSGSLSRCLGTTLIPLSICCILANILLFFPNGDTKYASRYLTAFVWYFAGIAGGGIVMALPAAVFINTGDCGGCCGKERCGRCCAMLGSVLAAFIGLVGSGYCFSVSVLALTIGPFCRTPSSWEYPFSSQTGRYLTDRDSWSICLEPSHVVEWNVTLFSILLALSGLEILICGVQVINGLLGGLCGACCYRKDYSMNP